MANLLQENKRAVRGILQWEQLFESEYQGDLFSAGRYFVTEILIGTKKEIGVKKVLKLNCSLKKNPL